MNRPAGTFVFCTLSEGDYHLGVAALFNSLVASGFQGVFVIGYRGFPPPWLGPTAPGAGEVHGIRVIQEEMRTPRLLAHVKPHFMLDILDRIVPEAEGVCYADPDIVIEASWTFFRNWIGRGVALCEDNCFSGLSRHHYLRHCWQEFAQQQLGLPVDSSIERGYNSGFVGSCRQDTGFLRTWRDALDQLEKSGVPLERLKPGSRLDAFFGTDQDMLNVAAMVHGGRLCTLGPEGMGFTSGMAVMWHAVEPPKPWRRAFVWDLIRTGRGVPQPHRQYWKHAAGPIKAWSRARLWLKRMDLITAIWLSRFYHSA